VATASALQLTRTPSAAVLQLTRPLLGKDERQSTISSTTSCSSSLFLTLLPSNDGSKPVLLTAACWIDLVKNRTKYDYIQVSFHMRSRSALTIPSELLQQLSVCTTGEVLLLSSAYGSADPPLRQLLRSPGSLMN